MAWFDFKTQAEVMNFKVFTDIKNSIGVSGLTGLDRLICFMIVTKLQVRKRLIDEKKTFSTRLHRFFFRIYCTFYKKKLLKRKCGAIYSIMLFKLYRAELKLLVRLNDFFRIYL